MRTDLPFFDGMARLCALAACASLLATGCAPEDHEDADRDATHLAIKDGVAVLGAGAEQQWEGIVNVRSAFVENGRPVSESCTATFITERHLLSAGHCFGKETQEVRLRAPTWDQNVWHSFLAATPHQASENNEIDLAVIDLGAPVAWATPARRFALYAGAPRPVDVFLYGYGVVADDDISASTPLRTAADRAAARIDRWDDVALLATADRAIACIGDSGGPALTEGTAPVLWGITQNFWLSIGDGLLGRTHACARKGRLMRFASVSGNLPFVERALGRACRRSVVDAQEVARCD